MASKKFKFDNRVKDFKMVPASELRANPRNWRKHPAKQRKAMEAVLSEIGFAGACLAYETADGITLIDGHLRATIAGEELVPVLILDVDENQAMKILATFDPLAAMAEADASELDGILREIETGSEELTEMLQSLAKTAGCDWTKTPQEVTEDEVPEPPKDPITKPGDLWLLGVYYECDTCGKVYEQAEGEAMKGVCPCG